MLCPNCEKEMKEIYLPDDVLFTCRCKAKTKFKRPKNSEEKKYEFVR